MFERRRTVRTLRKLALRKAKLRSIRVKRNFGKVNRLWGIACSRIGFSVFIGGCVVAGNLPGNGKLAVVGAIGMVLLAFRWVTVINSMRPPAGSALLFPVPAERFWKNSFKAFLFSALWSAIDATAIAIALILVNDRHSSALAMITSVPSIFAYTACMIVAPLCLSLFTSYLNFNPGRLLLFGALLSASHVVWDKFPAVFAVIDRWASFAAWCSPTGWFYLFESAHVSPVSRALIGTAAFVVAVWPVKFLAAAHEREIIKKEESEDIADASSVNETTDEYIEDIDAGQVRDFMADISIGEARRFLDEENWSQFSSPQTWLEKFFWRTLRERQKTVAKLIWPLGFRWKKPHGKSLLPLFYFLVAGGLLRAMSLRQEVFLPFAFGVIAIGALVLFSFAPALPASGYVFGQIYLGGRLSTRSQLFPVTTSEIKTLLGRCQMFRAAQVSGIAAAYGAVGGLILGIPLWAGVVSGLAVIMVSFALFPPLLGLQLATTIRHAGRRWMSLPAGMILTACIIGTLGSITTGIGMIAVAASENWPVQYFVGAILMVAVAFRIIGWCMLKIYIPMIDRSWLDAVVKPRERS